MIFLKIMCVMLVNKLRVTSFHTLSLLALLKLLLSSYFLMYGVLLVSLLKGINIM
jgi:hypothetical protein